jgi:hypothetical protein
VRGQETRAQQRSGKAASGPELEPELVLHGNYLGIGQAGVEIHPVDREVGRDQPAVVLGIGWD